MKHRSWRRGQPQCTTVIGSVELVRSIQVVWTVNKIIGKPHGKHYALGHLFPALLTLLRVVVQGFEVDLEFATSYYVSGGLNGGLLLRKSAVPMLRIRN